jgi:hypothetical protein
MILKTKIHTFNLWSSTPARTPSRTLTVRVSPFEKHCLDI